MDNQWFKINLNDFIEFNPKLSLKKGNVHKKVSMDNLNPFTKKILSFENEEFKGGSKFCNGDTIMARITPCLENGKTSYVDILDEGEIGFGSTEFIVLRAKENISDSHFIYYLSTTPFFRNIAIKSMVGTSGRQRVQIDALKNLEFLVPPLKEQQKISKILSSLDEKIEINRKINENLEEQAKEIFLNFIYNCDSKKCNIKDVITFANTGADAIKKAPIVNYDTGIRCVRVGDMSNNRDFSNWGFSDVTSEDFKNYKLHKNDILVSRTASIGLSLLIVEDLDAVYNNGIIRIIADENKILPIYLYYNLKVDKFLNYIKRIESETSVRPNMKINYLLGYLIKYPSLEEQKNLVDILNPIVNKKYLLIKQIQKLSSIRDELLPKLMTGEIDVSEIDI